MSSDAQALVRQLTENPEVLESMQHMLSLLRANPPKPASSAAAVAGPPTSANGGQRGRQPRTGFAEETASARSTQNTHSGAGFPVNSSPSYAIYNGGSNGSSSGNGGAPFYHDYHHHVSTDSGTSASPASTVADADRRTRRGSASGHRQYQQQHQQHNHDVTSVESEALVAATRQLQEAQRRISDLESELQRTAQRVERLGEVVQKQKSEMETAQDRHLLEMEEMRHAYDAVVRRKDEVQEEALRQLLKSRQLMVSAAKYEAAVVAAKRIEKENSSTNNSSSSKNGYAGDYAAGGLTSSAMAINARHSAVLSSSGVKRERVEDAPRDDAAGAYRSAYQHNDQQWQQSLKRAASDAWDTPVHQLRPTQQQQQQPRSTAVYAKTESPEFITSPTPAGKASTALVGGARTQSRSARKRRTPRTPSLTNADRIASKSGYSANKQQSVGGGLASQRQLPGTSSLKLDSPTPVVSSAWTVGRSMTSSHTPPAQPPAAPVALSAGCYNPVATTAVTTARQQHPHSPIHAAPVSPPLPSTRPPLTQRSAGRLAMTAVRRAVPNTRSGTSSVVADGPTRSPSPVDPKRGNTGPRRFIFTGLKDEELQSLSVVIAALGDDAAVLVSELDEIPPTSTTHIVLRGTPRSVKALCGVVSGKWLVSPEYILNSGESGFWLDEGEEGGLRIFPPPLMGQRFLLTVAHTGIRGKLAQVIEYGGGEVLAELGGRVAQDVVVITSGDDLLRYATEGHM